MARGHGEVNRLPTSLDDLRAGRGEWAGTPEGDAVAALHDANRSKRQAEEILRDGNLGWRNRRYWKRQLDSATTQFAHATDVHGRVVACVEADLRAALDAAEARLHELGPMPMPTHAASVADRGAAVERQLGRAAGAERDFGIELDQAISPSASSMSWFERSRSSSNTPA